MIDRESAAFQSISTAFARLETEGRTSMQNCGWTGRAFAKPPANEDYARYRAEATNLVTRVCGANSAFARDLERLAQTPHTSRTSHYFAEVFGNLQAAHNAWKEGLLLDLRAIVSADILGDLVTQADALLQADHLIGAACVAGAALEDAMRRLAQRHQVPGVDFDNTTINKLNDALCKAEIYDKNMQKRITAVAGVRNEAAHGHTDKVRRGDVEDMLGFVPRFLADYLGK